MGKISYRLVYNRAKHLNAEGKALLQIEAYLSGKRMYFTTHIYLAPKQWSEKKKQVVHHRDAEALNYLIRELQMDLEHREMELWRSGREVTLEALKPATGAKESSTFIRFVKEEIASAPHKKSTQKNRMTTLKLLSDFKPKLQFEEVDVQLVYGFEKYLKENGCGMNTIAKHLKHLRTWVNAAIGKGLMEASEYAFRSYKIRTTESKHTHLIREELQKLESIKLPPDQNGLKHSLDAFLFCCYTGLRYSDFVSLKEQDIVEVENHAWLIFHSVKTGVEVRLPLQLLFDGKPWELLGKYQGNWPSFFTLKSNSSVNHDLEKIGKLAGISKHISFHTARHTNATLLLYQGANITTIQKLLGHRNIGTTQIYSEVMDTTVVRDLERNIH